MKLTNFNESYLSGLVDMVINNYTENCSSLPENCNLHYKFEFGVSGGDKVTVKIIFNWLYDAKHVCIDKETDGWELQGEKCDDYFILTRGEKTNKLQLYVEEILERITK